MIHWIPRGRKEKVLPLDPNTMKHGLKIWVITPEIEGFGFPSWESKGLIFLPSNCFRSDRSLPVDYTASTTCGTGANLHLSLWILCWVGWVSEGARNLIKFNPQKIWMTMEHHNFQYEIHLDMVGFSIVMLVFGGVQLQCLWTSPRFALIWDMNKSNQVGKIVQGKEIV